MLRTYGGTVKRNGANVFGLIVFSIMLGIIIQKLKKDGRPLLELFDSLLKAVMLLVSGIMWYGICIGNYTVRRELMKNRMRIWQFSS